MAVSTTTQFEQLRATLKDSEVLMPEDPGYEQSIKRWNAAIENQPRFVIRPRSVQDISAVLKYRQEHGLDLAVGGGGHFSGDASSTAGGILLELSALKHITIDKNKRTAIVQGGALTGDVVRAADAHGLVVASPNVSKVGFTGITLVGGFGPLTGQFGLMSDNLVAAQVVLADGRVNTASKQENSELFWALRGAGPHVGIVSEVTVRLHELHNHNRVLAGALMFPPESASEVLQVLNEIVPDTTGRGTALIVLASPPPAFELMLIVSVFYDGTDEEAKTFFSGLYDLKPQVDFTSVMPYAKANTLVDWTAEHGQRQCMGSGVFQPPLSLSMLQSVIEKYRTFTQSAPNGLHVEVLFEFHNLTKVLDVPEDSTAFSGRGLTENVMVAVSYSNESDDSSARTFVKDVAQLTMTIQPERVGKRQVYSGYDNHFTDTKSVFGVEKYARLLALKSKYDPNGVFNKWYPVNI